MTETEEPAPKLRSRTVFVGSDDAAGVRAKLIDWSASGLVQPCIWLPVSAWKKARPDLHEVLAELIEPGGESESYFAALLGRSPIDVLRVVIIHIAPRPPGDPELTDLVADLLGRLRTHLPVASDLKAVNLIVPVSGVAGLDPEVLLESPHASAINVVVSPEDRSGDRNFNVGVRAGEGGNLDGHAALAAVTAAGLWTGMTTGPHDVGVFPSLAGRHVVVTRALVSSVHVEPVIDAVAEAALRPRDDWPLPGAGRVAAPIPALDPDRLVQRVVNQCGDIADKALQMKPFHADPPPEPENIGILRAFGRMFIFLWRRLLRVGSELGEQIKSAAVAKAEKLAQGLTFGTDSQFSVGVGGRQAPVLNAGSAIDQAQRVLEVAGVISDTYEPPTPQLWQSIRGVAFGLVQGSELPPPIDNASLLAGDRRQIITQPRFIAPDPFDPETAAVGAAAAKALGEPIGPLSCGDPYTVSLVRSALVARIQALSANEELEEEAKKAALKPVQQALSRLDAWAAQQAPSLLWQLALQSSNQVAGAVADLQAAESVLARGRSQDDDQRLRAAWRRCRRRWIFTFVVAAVVMYLVHAAELSSITTWRATAGIVVGALVLMTLAFFGYSRVEFQVLNRARKQAYELERAYEQALHAAREVVRLGSIYQQLVDWAEIIGGVARRPWGVPQGAPGTMHEPGSAGLPGAFRFGAGRASADDRAALVASASRRFYQGSWLTQAYTRFSAWALDRMTVQTALAEPPDPDVDTPLAPNGARSFLKQEVASSNYSRYAYEAGRGAVAEHLQEQPPAKVMSSVVPIASEMAATPVTAEEFFRAAAPVDRQNYLLAEIWSDAARAARKNAVEHCTLWAEGGLVDRTGAPWAEWHDIGDVELSNGGIGVKVIRLDRSQACTSEDLSLFTSDEGSQQEDLPRPTRSDAGD